MAVSRIEFTRGGPMFSRLIMGWWRLDERNITTSDLRHFVEDCVDLGLTSMDHADVYGEYTCEEIFGRVLAEDPALRDRMEIVTKCGIKLVSDERPSHGMKHYDTSRDHIVKSAENSLKAFATDRIDLLLIHRPDPMMNADEVAEAFYSLRKSGKVLHFGVSNFTPSQFDLLQSRLSFPLVTNQLEISVLELSTFLDGSLDQCQKLHIAPMAWSPFGGGDLFRSSEPRMMRVRKACESVGRELDGASIDQVTLAWLLTHPGNIVPIIGTGKLDRVRSAAAADNIRLTLEQWFKIWTASTGQEVP